MSEFLSMGGYGPYVWSSFALGVISLVYIYFSAKRHLAKQSDIVRDWQKRNKK